MRSSNVVTQICSKASFGLKMRIEKVTGNRERAAISRIRKLGTLLESSDTKGERQRASVSSVLDSTTDSSREGQHMTAFSSGSLMRLLTSALSDCWSVLCLESLACSCGRRQNKDRVTRKHYCHECILATSPLVPLT